MIRYLTSLRYVWCFRWLESVKIGVCNLKNVVYVMFLNRILNIKEFNKDHSRPKIAVWMFCIGNQVGAYFPFDVYLQFMFLQEVSTESHSLEQITCLTFWNNARYVIVIYVEICTFITQRIICLFGNIFLNKPLEDNMSGMFPNRRVPVVSMPIFDIFWFFFLLIYGIYGHQISKNAYWVIIDVGKEVRSYPNEAYLVPAGRGRLGARVLAFQLEEPGLIHDPGVKPKTF